MLKLVNVNKIYGTKTVVRNLNLQINPGSICCLLGKSGCGKTTTLKMINRLIEPSEGSIFINDENSTDVPVVEWRRRFGFVVQHFGLMPHLNVFENIELLSTVLKVPLKSRRGRSKLLLDRVGLSPKDYGQKYPRQLSGGQQQRVAIARALMRDPQILLMDEPFGALDPITRSALQTELLRLNEVLNKTIVMVTHDVREAKTLAHQVVLLNGGDIIQNSTFEELEKNPKNQFVKEFIESQLKDG